MTKVRACTGRFGRRVGGARTGWPSPLAVKKAAHSPISAAAAVPARTAEPSRPSQNGWILQSSDRCQPAQRNEATDRLVEALFSFLGLVEARSGAFPRAGLNF